MDFTWNDNHKMVARTVYDFARKTVMPVIKEHDRAHTFPHELLPQMAALGFLGIFLPVRYGGAGPVSYTHLCGRSRRPSAPPSCGCRSR